MTGLILLLLIGALALWGWRRWRGLRGKMKLELPWKRWLGWVVGIGAVMLLVLVVRGGR